MIRASDRDPRDLNSEDIDDETGDDDPEWYLAPSWLAPFLDETNASPGADGETSLERQE